MDILLVHDRKSIGGDSAEKFHNSQSDCSFIGFVDISIPRTIIDNG